MKKFLLRLLLCAIFLAVLYFFLARNLSWHEIAKGLHRLSWLAIFGALLLSFVISCLKALRFYLLVKKAGLSLSFGRALRLFFASQAASPLPAGETVRGALLVHETQSSTVEASGPVVAQAFLEIIAALGIVLAGSFYFEIFRKAAVILAVIVSALLFLFVHPKLLRRILEKPASWSWAEARVKSILHAQEQVSKLLLPKPRHGLFTFSIIGLAFLADIVGGLLILFLAVQLGAPLSFGGSIFIYAMSVGIQGLCAVIPGGLGVTEGGMLGILRLWEVPFSLAVPLVMVFRLLTLIFTVVLGLLILSIFYSKKWMKL